MIQNLWWAAGYNTVTIPLAAARSYRETSDPPKRSGSACLIALRKLAVLSAS